jgi:hypothetical protein
VEYIIEEAGYAAMKTRLPVLGVSLGEQGLRLRVAELETIEAALTAGGNRGLTALVNCRTLEGMSTTDPSLEVIKSLEPDAAHGFAAVGAGTSLFSITEAFDASAMECAPTFRHEVAHLFMAAIDAVHRVGLTSKLGADLESVLRFRRGRSWPGPGPVVSTFGHTALAISRRRLVVWRHGGPRLERIRRAVSVVA